MKIEELVTLLRNVSALCIQEVQSSRNSTEAVRVIVQKMLEDISPEELRRAVLSYKKE